MDFPSEEKKIDKLKFPKIRKTDNINCLEIYFVQDLTAFFSNTRHICKLAH